MKQNHKNQILTKLSQTLIIGGLTTSLILPITISTIQPTFAYAQTNINTSGTYLNNNDYRLENKKNIDTINGYLTPYTWYQPAKVMTKNGQMRKTYTNDTRPLLSVWWPNRQTQINYINFMHEVGFSNVSVQSNTDQATLNQVANQIHETIDKKIDSLNGQITWLKFTMDKFIKSQPQWNLQSEDPKAPNLYNGLQNGGFFKYSNSKLTPYANSNYRILNRDFGNHNGQHPNLGGGDLLLGDDVDNSNPIVQAEDLNWLNYIMKFGSINHQSNANFDGLRIDATGSMDIDVNDIVSAYFKNVLHANKNEATALNHLMISEAPQTKTTDPDRLLINKNAATLSSLQKALSGNPGARTNISALAETNKNSIPTYGWIDQHDNNDAAPYLAGFKPNDDKNITAQANQAIDKIAKQVYQNEHSVDKDQSQYNIPMMYALFLSEKNLVPRVSYADLYNGAAGYMEQKTPYYDAITTLMRARVKYVNGDENRSITNLTPNNTPNTVDNNQVLVQVRNGNTPTEGMGTVLSNNPNLKFGDNDRIKISFGANHKNQKFRPVINTTTNGLAVYHNDSDVPASEIKETDNNGDLYLTKQDIQSVNNPFVSGYVSTWVPYGAPENQDARTTVSTKKHSKHLIYPGAALDSNIFYQGFSNYQPIEKNPDTYRKISQNAKLIKSWGVTYIEFPPAYRPTTKTDPTFQDSIFKNGFDIQDRYDFGYKTPTKYGTVNELLQAVSSVHQAGFKAMADFVPNQIYNLPKKQVVNVVRSNWKGYYIGGNAMKNKLYVTNSLGSGNDYQTKFGGKYLNQLKKDYPAIFKQKQISTGKPINPNVHLKIWSAKYLNGTALQGNGSDSVLSSPNGTYYRITKNNINLPDPLA